MNIKIKLKFFSHNKLKFQPRTWKTFMFNITGLFCSMICEQFCSVIGSY